MTQPPCVHAPTANSNKRPRNEDQDQIGPSKRSRGNNYPTVRDQVDGSAQVPVCSFNTLICYCLYG